MKIWNSIENGDDAIIACNDELIIKGNPKPSEVNNCISDLELNKIPFDNFITIPFSYLKEISIEEGKENIEILFGSDSSEILKIKDEKTKNDIFDFFKINIPNSFFIVDRYTPLKAAKKPLIAMGIIVLIFSYIFYLVKEIKSGTEFELVGSGASLAGIIAAIASLGFQKVTLLFLAFITIPLIGSLKKANNPPTIHKLKINT